jgi:hypothetical protein
MWHTSHTESSSPAGIRVYELAASRSGLHRVLYDPNGTREEVWVDNTAITAIVFPNVYLVVIGKLHVGVSAVRPIQSNVLCITSHLPSTRGGTRIITRLSMHCPTTEVEGTGTALRVRAIFTPLPSTILCAFLLSTRDLEHPSLIHQLEHRNDPGSVRKSAHSERRSGDVVMDEIKDLRPRNWHLK